jgi:hypothetical protein
VTYLDTYAEYALAEGLVGDSEEEFLRMIDSAKIVWERIAEEGEGLREPQCLDTKLSATPPHFARSYPRNMALAIYTLGGRQVVTSTIDSGIPPSARKLCKSPWLRSVLPQGTYVYQISVAGSSGRKSLKAEKLVLTR